ncbi:hypothetical protein B296_00012675 [Ensete ventricosum]|uniref:Uncharacterized protein n=1 Tax=Ensete ventricosum TaxID=4639 RepID=A0A427B901_ENSVE|nr:hypothetical protein B296_00012675 [Ensete ventricosum]
MGTTMAVALSNSRVCEMEQYQILTAIVATAADVGSATKGDDDEVDNEIRCCLGQPTRLNLRTRLNQLGPDSAEVLSTRLCDTMTSTP